MFSVCVCVYTNTGSRRQTHAEKSTHVLHIWPPFPLSLTRPSPGATFCGGQRGSDSGQLAFEAASAFLIVVSLIFIVASSSVRELVFEVGIDTGSLVHARGE